MLLRIQIADCAQGSRLSLAWVISKESHGDGPTIPNPTNRGLKRINSSVAATTGLICPPASRGERQGYVSAQADLRRRREAVSKWACPELKQSASQGSSEGFWRLFTTTWPNSTPSTLPGIVTSFWKLNRLCPERTGDFRTSPLGTHSAALAYTFRLRPCPSLTERSKSRGATS